MRHLLRLLRRRPWAPGIGWSCAVGKLSLYFATCALLLSLTESISSAAERGLRVWLVLNLPAASAAAQPSVDQYLEEWSRQGIDLFGLRDKSREDPDFRQLL